MMMYQGLVRPSNPGEPIPVTILSWPPDRNRRHPKATQKLVGDPLPESILHSLVSDLPGPNGETEPERLARFKLQLAQVLAYNPRNAAEAMLATHCILMRMMAEESQRDGVRHSHSPAMVKKFLQSAKQFERLVDEMERTIGRRQTRELTTFDRAVFEGLGIGQLLPPEPEDPDQPEEAFSAIIVPLHPAPKMLQ